MGAQGCPPTEGGEYAYFGGGLHLAAEHAILSTCSSSARHMINT